METREKLRIIQNVSGLTQVEIANKVGVSFVALNNWWNGKSLPRAQRLVLIDGLYKEYTGQKVIPKTILIAKKELIMTESRKFPDILGTIFKNPDIYNQFLLSLTYNSNKIEGSTLSENETADILFENKTIAGKSLTEQIEAKNHQTALEYLFNFLKNGKSINENLILKLHSILMNGIRDDAGFYRNHGVRIMGSNIATANYLKLPELMKNLANKIGRDGKDVVANVSKIHAKFEQIHPFSDGNGRIGRLILSAMLIKKGLAPAVIKQDKKRLYYVCLQRAQTKSDYTQLEEFICDAILDGFKIVIREDE